MSLYLLTTNEGEQHVTCKPTREQMYRYIRAKQAQGLSLAEVIFCWAPVTVSHSIEGHIAIQERKGAATTQEQRDSYTATRKVCQQLFGRQQA